MHVGYFSLFIQYETMYGIKIVVLSEMIAIQPGFLASKAIFFLLL